MELSRRPQNAEQLYQRNSCTVKKVLGPTTDFLTWGSGKGTEPPENLTLDASGIWLQKLHRTGETVSWRAQTRPCAHQDPGEKSSDPTRDWPRLACECPEVSNREVGWWWPAAGSGALSAAVYPQDLLKEVVFIFITSTIVWSQVKQHKGTQP